jgi:hypothetical protein
MNIKQAFQLFELDAKSSPEAFKKRYHELAAVWHPDRHANDSHSQKRASDKMKEINTAYEVICTHLNSYMIVVCHSCGAENRKRIDLNVDYAACSTCGKQLRKPLARKKRTPCGNSRCAGTIGSNSRCTFCGKTIEEGRGCTPQGAGVPRETRTPGRNGAGRRLAALLVLAALGVVLYVNRDRLHRLAENHFEPARHPPAAVEQPEPIIPPSPVERKPSIYRTGSPPTTVDDSYYAALLGDRRVGKEDAAKLQQILKTLGYEIGKPDGLISARTIACFKQYCLDFGYIPGESFPACFFKNSSFHYQIALDHPDWREIYLTRDLENWIRALPDSRREQIGRLALDRPGAAVQLLRRYKFEKFKPIPASLPETGIIRKNYSGASDYLKIKTRTENNNYYIKLIHRDTDREALSAFIRSGSTLSVQLPPGVYELKYAAGRNWYGLDCLFGTSASYGKLPQPIVLTQKSRPAGSQSIELMPGQHGRLTTEIISEYDF